jgi:ATP phosphoribosyltransferase
MKKSSDDKEVNQILEGLTGDIRIGQRYYVFTVTYAYIARVTKVSDWAIHFEDVTIVSQAGSEVDAVTKIVNEKKKPEACEETGKPLIITKQSITALIPF